MVFAEGDEERFHIGVVEMHGTVKQPPGQWLEGQLLRDSGNTECQTLGFESFQLQR